MLHITSQIPIKSNEFDKQILVNIILSLKIGLNVQILLWQRVLVKFQLHKLDIA